MADLQYFAKPNIFIFSENNFTKSILPVMIVYRGELLELSLTLRCLRYVFHGDRAHFESQFLGLLRPTVKLSRAAAP